MGWPPATEPDGLAARDRVVEHAREGRLVTGAVGDPHVQPVRLSDVTVEMHAEGADAEHRGGGAPDSHQRRPVPVRRYRIELAPPSLDQPVVRQLPQGRVNRPGPRFEIVESGRQGHRVGADLEDIRPAPQFIGQRGRHVSDAAVAHPERAEPGGIEIIAGADVIEIGHWRTG